MQECCISIYSKGRGIFFKILVKILGKMPIIRGTVTKLTVDIRKLWSLESMWHICMYWHKTVSKAFVFASQKIAHRTWFPLPEVTTKIFCMETCLEGRLPQRRVSLCLSPSVSQQFWPPDLFEHASLSVSSDVFCSELCSELCQLWTLLKHSSSDFTSLPSSQPWGVQLHILIVVIRQLAALAPTSNFPAPLPNWTTVFLTMWFWQDRSHVQFLEWVLTGWHQSACPISPATTTGLGMDQVGPSTSVKFNLLEYVLQCCCNNG